MYYDSNRIFLGWETETSNERPKWPRTKLDVVLKSLQFHTHIPLSLEHSRFRLLPSHSANEVCFFPFFLSLFVSFSFLVPISLFSLTSQI